jgi:hypothetical protein
MAISIVRWMQSPVLHQQRYPLAKRVLSKRKPALASSLARVIG